MIDLIKINGDFWVQQLRVIRVQNQQQKIDHKNDKQNGA